MQIDYEKRLTELGFSLPDLPPRAGLYVPAVRTGNLVFCSSQGPLADGAIKFVGKVGAGLSVEDGMAAARICALNCLAAITTVLGSLNGVQRIVQVRGYVNSAPDFHDQPKVINGASQLLLDIFGAAGEHARAAIGTSNLPLDITVELDMVVEASA